MSERFWRNLSCSFGWLSIGVLFALVTLSSCVEIRDLDLWLHLGVGRWISQHGFVPGWDILSCTIAGKPWVNHEWLFQVFAYQISRMFGMDGLITMQSLVVAFTFLVLLFLGYSRERQWLVVFALLQVLIVYETRFTIRPDIFSLLFFALYIYILSLHLNKRWMPYALVIIQILWTNMHGFFFFGPLLVLVGVIAEFLKRRLKMPYEYNSIGRLTDNEYASLKKMLFLVILASCLNPLGLQGAWYPFGVFFHLAGDNSVFFKYIVELQRPMTPKTIWTDQYLNYKILILLSGVSLVFNRRKIDISSVMVWGVFLAFSLVAIRNLVFFAVAAYLVLMVNAISIPWKNIVPLHFSSDRFKFMTGIPCKIFLIVWMIDHGMQIASNGYFDFDTYTHKREYFGINKHVYPAKAVDFLVRHDIKGNFFNDFNSGAYMVGRVFPRIKVFIDGRTEEYGSIFFDTYQKIWQQGKSEVFKPLERRYHITGALLNNAHQEIPAPVLRMFYSFKNWSIVYFDYDGVIFLKQTPANKPIIDKYRAVLSQHAVVPMDLFRLSNRRIAPFPFTARARLLEVLGYQKAAIKECQEALKIYPTDAAAYKILGKIYHDRRDYQKAFVNFRWAAMYDSASVPLYLDFALSYEDLKDYQGAIARYEDILEAYPKNSRAVFGLARVFALQGQMKKAEEFLEKAKKLDPADKVDVKKIRDIIDKKAKPGTPKKKM